MSHALAQVGLQHLVDDSIRRCQRWYSPGEVSLRHLQGVIRRDASDAPKLLNARAESIAFKFGECLRERRMLIPADGFYEWKAVGKKKQACHFTRQDGAPFAFAGLWDVWQDEDLRIVGACMVTTSPNEVVQPYHDRMPVILPRESYPEWLDPETEVERLLALLTPYPADLMRAKQVGPAVNSSRNEGPECLASA